METPFYSYVVKQLSPQIRISEDDTARLMSRRHFVRTSILTPVCIIGNSLLAYNRSDAAVAGLIVRILLSLAASYAIERAWRSGSKAWASSRNRPTVPSARRGVKRSNTLSRLLASIPPEERAAKQKELEKLPPELIDLAEDVNAESIWAKSDYDNKAKIEISNRTKNYILLNNAKIIVRDLKSNNVDLEKRILIQAAPNTSGSFDIFVRDLPTHGVKKLAIEASNPSIESKSTGNILVV